MDIKINSAWSATSAVLKNNFSFYDIKEIVGLAGFDSSRIAHLVQRSGSTVSKGQLITSIDQGLSDFSDDTKRHFLNIVIEEILERNPNLEEQLEKYLSRLGWQIVETVVIPIKIMDRKDLEELDESAKNDLIKAAKRFRDGDLSGALSAACGAIDGLTNRIYNHNGLGDATKASFQERCKVALKEMGIFSAIGNELKAIDWKDSGIITFIKNFEGALNQATYVMQSLRANMSDVHGTKPVLKPLVYDSIKWAQIIARLLSHQYGKRSGNPIFPGGTNRGLMASRKTVRDQNHEETQNRNVSKDLVLMFV
jgi:hypothetical protein